MHFVLLVFVSKAGYMGMFSVQYLEKLASKSLIFRRVSFCEDKCKKRKTTSKIHTKKILLYSVRQLKSGRRVSGLNLWGIEEVF